MGRWGLFYSSYRKRALARNLGIFRLNFKRSYKEMSDKIVVSSLVSGKFLFYHLFFPFPYINDGAPSDYNELVKETNYRMKTS